MVNRYSLHKVVQTLFVFYLLFFLISFFYSILTNPAEKLIRSFTWPYIWTSSFVLFVDYLIPITSSAVMIAYALFFRMKDIYNTTGMVGPFYRLVSSNLILFVFLSLVYTVLIMGFYPAAHYRLERMISQSRQAKAFFERALRETDVGNYASALSYYDLYLVIDPENTEVLEAKSRTQSQLYGRRKQEALAYQASESEVSISSLRDTNAHELIEKAREYYNKEDYYSAHYYATLAQRMDSTDLESRRIAAIAWEKIASLEPTGSDREAAILFGRKKEGYTALINGDYITAYYIFNELKQVYPNDPDIISYLSKSKEGVAKVSFFLDEAEKIDPFPGVEKILFINDTEDGSREIVSIGKMVETDEGVFFQHIEAIQFQPDGKVIYHLHAPYGKLIENHINMSGIHRLNKDQREFPVYYAGFRHGELDTLLPLRASLDNLSNLRVGVQTARQMSLDALWQVREVLARYGYIKKYLDREIIVRILYPFCFLILSLLSISIGWTYRTRYLSRPSLLSFLFIPIFPLIITMLTSLFLSAQLVIIAFILVKYSFAASLTCLLIMQSVFLVVTLIILAGQRSE